ncbi:hypothetical protein AVEN_221401-1, partial [Araneus ventricosus]
MNESDNTEDSIPGGLVGCDPLEPLRPFGTTATLWNCYLQMVGDLTD